jgi:hypothetical protein
MKQRMQGMVMGVLVTALLLGTVTVFAATPRTIEATFGNFRTYIFGQEFVSRNAQGEILQPFMYNGSLYLPAEAVLHAMGNNASWDVATGAFSFGGVQQPTPEERISLNMAAPLFDSGSFGGRGGHISRIPDSRVRDSVRMGGTYYRDVIVYRSASLSRPGRNGSFTLHNLNGQFSNLTGYIGRVDESAMYNATVTISGDGNVLQAINLRATDMPVPISISVVGVRQLRVEVEFAGTGNTLDTRASYAIAAFLE